jgi:hypothetical protein
MKVVGNLCFVFLFTFNERAFTHTCLDNIYRQIEKKTNIKTRSVNQRNGPVDMLDIFIYITAYFSLFDLQMYFIRYVLKWKKKNNIYRSIHIPVLWAY